MQTTLFRDTKDAGLSIKEAAQQAGVSSATIRNWIKTGYLKEDRKGRISTVSFARFYKEVAGRDKLNHRANKSLKDSHNHTELSSKFIQKMLADEQNAESLGSEYEASLSDSYRNKEGIYYTPPSVVADLFRIPATDISSKTFCDPCCGSGNFIIRAIDLGFKPENIYGYDIDPVAAALTKKRIFEQTGYTSENIITADFLAIASKSNAHFQTGDFGETLKVFKTFKVFKQSNTWEQEKFDYIYTNPPWGKKLSKAEKVYYGALFNAGKSIDTCALFFFACLKCLKMGGELGLLLPESFFNIAAFESARIKALSLDIKRLIDYEKPFKGLITKAFAVVLANQSSEKNAESIVCEVKGNKYKRSALSFSKNPKSIFNLQCDPFSSDVIRHVFSIPHITLKGRAKWGLGIVTGNNKKFSRSEPAQGYIPVWKGSDIKKGKLLDPSCYIPEDLSLYQQAAPTALFTARSKLIYKFISSDLCFFCDTKQRYILNSANMLIPLENFPLSGDQLCSILNSDFMNWMFKTIFNTHKILRGDLETLPIHADYFNRNDCFDERFYLEFLQIKRDGNGGYRIKT